MAAECDTNAPMSCILVLCGLPASGKTSLANLLNDSSDGLQRYLAVSACSVLTIQYDELFPEEGEKSLITTATEDSASKWKHYRDEIKSCVYETLQIAQGKKAAQNLVINDERLKEKFYERIWPQVETKIKNYSAWLVIIDDNMYYKSMRYEYYQMARELGTGYAVVHVDCSVEQCLQNNAARPPAKMVPDKVIQDMSTKLEVPNPAENHWESNLLVIPSEKLSNASVFTEVVNMISHAFANPEEDRSEELQAIREESRKICSENLRHQTDQILRKLIGLAMKALPAGERKKKASSFASIKSLILQDLEQGKFSLALSETPQDGGGTESAFQDAVNKIFLDYCQNKL